LYNNFLNKEFYNKPDLIKRAFSLLEEVCFLILQMLIKAKFSVLLVVLLNILIGQVLSTSSQVLGINLYQSSSNNSYLQFKPIDIIGNGIYTTAEFHTPHLSLINSMYATTDNNAAIKGNNKAVKNIYGYTNEAVLKATFSIDEMQQQIYLGRDYFYFGVGKTSSLFISRESRPFDQVRWQYEYKNISGGLTAIQLDNIDNEKRYLTLHTFKYSKPAVVDVLFGEAILYSGINRSIELQYFNPFLFWMPEVVNNTTGDANGFLYAGLTLKMIQTWEFWGEILIDDFQINNESKGDLEPNELGLTTGFGKSSFPFTTSSWFLEYTLIANRTYQTPQLSETYAHRGFPIGHYLGNDFDLWQMHYEQEISFMVSTVLIENIKFYCDLAYLRDGINGMDTPFDTPWEDSTVTMETGYSEPFPTGPITYITELETGLDFYFKNGSYLNIGMFLQRQEFHEKVDYNYSLVLRVWFNLSKKFNY